MAWLSKATNKLSKAFADAVAAPQRPAIDEFVDNWKFFLQQFNETAQTPPLEKGAPIADSLDRFVKVLSPAARGPARRTPSHGRTTPLLDSCS